MKIQATLAVIIAALGYGDDVDTTGSQNLCRTTGAKVYYRGGGWWVVCGASTTDGPKTVELINSLKSEV